MGTDEIEKDPDMVNKKIIKEVRDADFELNSALFNGTMESERNSLLLLIVQRLDQINTTLKSLVKE